MFYKSFQYDRDTFPDANMISKAQYDPEYVEAIYLKHLHQGKIHFAIVLNEEVIGDVYLKHIDQRVCTCEMGIVL